MTGRSVCMDQRESKTRTEEFTLPNDQASSLYASTPKDIPPLLNRGSFQFPSLEKNSRNIQRPLSAPFSTLHRPFHSIPVTSFQEPSFALSVPSSSNSDTRATETGSKLPPIHSVKSSTGAANMPPHHGDTAESGKMPPPSLMDMRLAYENMIVSYFMPQCAKSESDIGSEETQAPVTSDYQQRSNQLHYGPGYSTHSLPTINQLLPGYQGCDNSCQNARHQSSEGSLRILQNKPTQFDGEQKNIDRCSGDCKQTVDAAPPLSVHSTIDVTPSGCTMLDPVQLNQYRQQSMSEQMLKSECGFHAPSSAAGFIPSSGEMLNSQGTDMSALLNNMCMYIPPQDGREMDHSFPESRVEYPTQSTMNTTTTTTSNNSSFNFQCQTKPETPWGRFSVLPPVMTSGQSYTGGADSVSTLSCNSALNNAQSNSQMGNYYPSFSPFAVNFTDNLPSAFVASPRYSARSSYSGRGSRQKRALSNSPLSAEGIDLNSIIRMSPTSLVAYLNGSRSSSSCISRSSSGDKTGCYGHLSARNSSSSPPSGSGSSGNRRSSSYTPQLSTPTNGRSNQSNTISDSSNVSNPCCDSEDNKTDFLDVDNNLLVIQAMQDLEASAGMADASVLPFNANLAPFSQMIPECENLQILPQDVAAFATEDYVPAVPNVLPPVHTHLQSHFPSHSKPPPSYDQHMARKATLQKNSSSESSQPSNSSSFESSEGDKTAAGSSSTDTEVNRVYVCKWLDCTAVFQDQDEFVTHIEKVHIDQRKGEDFVCFWKLCPRRLHPFNARYKLLVHMRVHSGDKPNKCTYAGCKKAFSRLENLKIHLRSHTGERPYSCTFAGCTKTFSNSSDRTKHQKTHHETKPYVCQVAGCDKRYTDPSSLRKHAKKSHAEKSEPGRKKIRGGVEELDPKDLSECLVIQAIKPLAHCDASPPEPTDSGLGRSPRGSQPGSSSDQYPGYSYSCEISARSGTALENSSHTSPSSQHSSPPSQTDRDKLPNNNNNLRVPVLPPIVQPPETQHSRGISTQIYNSRTRPSSISSLSRVRGPSLPMDVASLRSSSSMTAIRNMNTDNMSCIYTSGSLSTNYRPQDPSPESHVTPLPRYEGHGS